MPDAPLFDRERGSARALAIGLGGAWATIVLPLTIVATIYLFGRPPGTITTYFFLVQDAGPLLLASLVFPLAALISTRLDNRRTLFVATLAERRAWPICLTAALMVGASAFAGWWLIYQTYPLSMDEFCAAFDARILSRGKLLAQLPAEWRPYAVGLQPWFVAHSPDGQYWVSQYLPMNAAFLALGGALGSQALAGPFWAGLSIVTVYGLARRLWPERRDAALVSALLLATSPQLFITAMSPYAMSAHLALNLVWLWLFLRKGWPWHGLAAAAGFAATGLHQVLFHPLFAAPFVLQLWLSRRWRLAGFYTIAYAAICLFWISYGGLLMQSHGVAPAVAATKGAGDFAHRTLALIALPNSSAWGLMALNLLRFAAWQNPLAIALAGLGAVFAVRGRDPILAPLVAGMALTVAAMLIVMPFQGHGWGYRYLHGFLGAGCLLAAFAWVKLSPSKGEGVAPAWSAFSAAAAYSILLALPLRAMQAFTLISGYAPSYGAIQRARADVVILDPVDLVYGVDLDRNDPFLERGPKVMDIGFLTAAQATALCGHYRVALFDRTDGLALGRTAYPATAPTAAKAEVLRSLSCAAHVAQGPAAPRVGKTSGTDR